MLLCLVYNKAGIFFFGYYAACLVIYIYIIMNCNKIPSSRKNKNKTVDLSMCKTKFRKIIMFKNNVA